MTTELGRIAHTALRSSIVRSSTTRINTCPRALKSATAASRSRSISSATLASSMRSLSLANDATIPQRRQQSGWASSPRKKDAYDDSNIMKPKGPTSSNPANSPDTSAVVAKPGISMGLSRSRWDEDDEFAGGYGDLATEVDKWSQSSLQNDDFSIPMGTLNKTPGESSEPPRREMRMAARLGRTVHVSKGADVSRSFKALDRQVAANRVRQDFAYQKFHERPGMKRKRLKSVRWQRRFMKGFKATVSRVNELRRQGW